MTAGEPLAVVVGRLVEQARQAHEFAAAERALRPPPAWLVSGTGRCVPALGLHQWCEHDVDQARPLKSAHHNPHNGVPGCTE